MNLVTHFKRGFCCCMLLFNHVLLYSDQPHKRRMLTFSEAPPPDRLWADKAWENGALRRSSIEETYWFLSTPPPHPPQPLLSQLLVSFLLIGLVSFTDSGINRSTSSRVFLALCDWNVNSLKHAAKATSLVQVAQTRRFRNAGCDAYCELWAVTTSH